MSMQEELDMDAVRRQQLVDATIHNKMDTVIGLVESDHALIDHRVNRRSTLLSIAAQHGHVELAQYFVARGCPVNAYCGTPVSAIIWAARLPDGVGMIRLLVEAGARLGPRARDPRWCIAPIHEAARLKRAANCLCLAELGADPEVKMGGNLTAFEMAGPSSYASKCMREGIRRREVRMIMRKLHYIAQPSLLHDTAEGKNDCMKQRLQKVLAEREKAGKKPPVLSLSVEAIEGSSGGAAKAGAVAKHEKRRTLSRLMRLLFERLDFHVRSEMVETACSVLNPSGDEANLSFGKYAGKEKVDPLLVSAHRCWQTVVAQEATQRADASKQKKSVDNPVLYSAQYWRKWQGQKKKEYAESQAKQVIKEPLAKKKRARPLRQGYESLAPSLQFSSQHRVLRTTSFGPSTTKPISAGHIHADDGREVGAFLHQSGLESGGFSRSTREDWQKCAPQPGRDGHGPARYDVSRGLAATLPRHAVAMVAGGSAPSDLVGAHRNIPGPGAYDPLTKSNILREVSFGKLERTTDLAGGQRTAPGPGAYELPSLFAPVSQKASSRRMRGFPFNGVEPYEQPPPSDDTDGRDPFVGFGHGCDFAQHTAYGMCLDLHCSQRGRWEQTNAFKLSKAQDEEKKIMEQELKAKLTDPSTPLHFAVQREELDVVERILMDGMSPDVIDPTQRTPLHYAAELGNYRIVRRLVQNDKHPFVTCKGFEHPRQRPTLDMKDKEGNTCMHLAAIQGHWLVLEFLFQAGARCDLRNHKQQTPLDVAKTDVLYSKLMFMLEIEETRQKVLAMEKKIQRLRETADGGEERRSPSFSSSDGGGERRRPSSSSSEQNFQAP